MSNPNFNLNANNFYAYMQSLAQQHKDILHTEADKHFFIGELEEFYLGLRSKVNFPALVVEGFNLYVSVHSKTEKGRKSSFTVVFAYDQDNDYEAIIECYSHSEDVGLEILRRMDADGEELSCQVRVEDIEGLQIINDQDRYAGIRFDFVLVSYNNPDIQSDKWQKKE